ncbi:MAG TPA: GDSL-type esterase/lipase family protein [Gemmatimonadaceae bacterium]|nr:GDSL-type esterase/lipase family protein [Gemmatimonadaceae bacterium]
MKPDAGRGARALSPRRRALFTAIALLLPFVLLAGAELVLRLTWRAGALPLFVTTRLETGDQLIANPRVARRWFTNVRVPPGPIPEPFAIEKPAHGFRLFVLGESTTAGFPYPHNGTFSRMLADALRDVLPADSIEVVNLGIAATSSYALVDEAGEVIAQRPDAVLIYAGHNEYYGALAVGSTNAVLGGSPGLVRAYLRLERLRLVRALQDALSAVRGAFASRRDTGAVRTMMEVQARDQSIALDGPTYRRGERQFEDNLDVLLRKFRAARVPVFIASQASNLRDQHPFVAAGNAGAGGADSAYARAQAALAHGDTAGSRSLFVRARDLDVVRFRAPSALNAIIRRVAARDGAVYVPVAEAFAASAPDGIPGSELFLEHVHPNEHGATIIAHTFFDAIAGAHFLGRPAELGRLRSWPEYTRRMDLTPFDERIVQHSVRTVTSRWPFVPEGQASNYRRSYRPVNLLDSLSLMVAAGAPWTPAKLRLAQDYQRRGFADSAIAELRGVARDTPEFAEPWELLGKAFLAAREDDSAAVAFGRALAIRPTAQTAATAGTLALRRHDLPGAIALLRRSLVLQPDNPGVLYQLSLAYGLAHDVSNARSAALRLHQVAPGFPGLAEWLRLLGVGG